MLINANLLRITNGNQNFLFRVFILKYMLFMHIGLFMGDRHFMLVMGNRHFVLHMDNGFFVLLMNNGLFVF